MSLGPTVLRSRSIPFPTVAGLALAAFFVIQALIVDAWMTVLSLAVAACFAAGAGWSWFQARRSSVLIDTNQFIVKDGARQEVYDVAEIDRIDLASLTGHVKFRDGTAVSLPLEGDQLVQAGLLLTPAKRHT